MSETYQTVGHGFASASVVQIRYLERGGRRIFALIVKHTHFISRRSDRSHENDISARLERFKYFHLRIGCREYVYKVKQTKK